MLPAEDESADAAEEDEADAAEEDEADAAEEDEADAAEEDEADAAEEDEAEEGVRRFFILKERRRRATFSPSSVNSGSSRGSRI